MWLAGIAVADLVVGVGVGYLIGSLSGARLVGRLVAPSTDVTRVEMTFDDGASYESRAASASAVRANVGTPWGVLTGILDGLKVVAPMLVARVLGLGEAVEIGVALGGLLGHVLPVWHRFRGGLGETPTYAALLVLDPVGVLVAVALATVAGFLTGRVVVLREGAVPIVAVWSVLVRDDALVAAFAGVAIVVYYLAALPESRRYSAAVAGRRVSNEELSREYGMGSGLGRAIDRYGFPALLRRLGGRRVA